MRKTLFPYTHAHLVGIKGVAMAALATYLHDRDVMVTGSDIADDFPTKQELDACKIAIHTGFDGERMKGDKKPDVVYYTGAHNGRDNAEVRAALDVGIPVFPHGQALGDIMKQSKQIVVSGSHGKTTTSAMIAVLLKEAHYDPSYAIGCGSIQGFGAAGAYGTSDWFVAEGDEYVTDPGHDPTPRFLWLRPEILVVTNIDYDHPDAYASLEAVQEAFIKLQEKSSTVIFNADDPNCRVLSKRSTDITYGFSPAADYVISHVGVGSERMFFTLEERGTHLGEFAIKVPGKHNVANAVAAMIAAHVAGVSWDVLKKSILSFRGTKRRFEKLNEKNGVIFYDDYAHHPTEIMATLKAARSWYPEQIITAVFQPHTYSRTKSLLTEFGNSFRDANMVILTDIYASAREHDTLGIDGMTLVHELSKHHGNVRFAGTKHAVGVELKKTLGTHDVVIFMGAGDIYNWEEEIIRQSMEASV